MPQKRGFEKKLFFLIRTMILEERVDLVAGGFNGVAWRQSNGNNPQSNSIIEEAFADTDFPMPRGPTPV